MLIHLWILAAVSFIIASCSPTIKSKLGLDVRGPDASNISEHQHLKVPPIFYEKLPEPINSDEKHIKKYRKN